MEFYQPLLTRRVLETNDEFMARETSARVARDAWLRAQKSIPR